MTANQHGEIRCVPITPVSISAKSLLHRSDIGGDTQRIFDRRTDYRGLTFKNILLPIWVSSYRDKAKVFRFVVNARTGERPWSTWKITGAVIADIIVLAPWKRRAPARPRADSTTVSLPPAIAKFRQRLVCHHSNNVPFCFSFFMPITAWI